MSEHRCAITLTVNGETVSETVDARKTLVDFLRDDLVLTGSHVGCEHGVCGACTVRLDGVIVRGCLTLAAQCDGATVETIEGVSDTGEIADLQKAFEQRNALQCGFCTPGMLLTAQELAGEAAACRAATKSASRFPATTAAAPAITPSSTPSSRWRKRGTGNENRRRQSSAAHRARPAEFLYRPLGAAAKPGAADARPRAICQRRGAAADGACGVCPFAARARQDRFDRRGRGEKGAGRDRGRHRRGTGQGHHAVGRRAHPSQGPEIGAAARHRGRPRLLGRRGGLRRGGAQPRRGRGRLRAGRGRLRGIAAGHRCGNRARSEHAGDPSLDQRQSLFRARADRRRSRQGLRRGRRRGRDHLRVRPPHRRHQRAALDRRRLESRRRSA